jgi:hypothetical protein
MSEPAIFVFVRDKTCRFYLDRWAGVFLFRDLIWGPDQLENWAQTTTELADWTNDIGGGVVVDYDEHKMTWYNDNGQLDVPKVADVYDRLLKNAWPDFAVSFADGGLSDLANAAGVEHPDGVEFDDEVYRAETVGEAGIEDNDEQDEDNEDEDDQDLFDLETVLAWVTIISQDGTIQQRTLQQLPDDLLNGDDGVLLELEKLGQTEIPPESIVGGGMWIDVGKGEIRLWGARSVRRDLVRVQEGWQGWDVQWAEGGYPDQCQLDGALGTSMSEVAALARIVPTMLSTKRFDLGMVFGVLGDKLKETAIKATGCLLMLICIPMLVLGFVTERLPAMAVSIGVVFCLAVIVFKYGEHRVRKSFSQSNSKSAGGDTSESRPVPGPLDDGERRAQLNVLLNRCGMASVDQIEPHFPDHNMLTLFD